MYKLNPFTGSLDITAASITSSSPSGYVPYVGATSDVNLGLYSLTSPIIYGATASTGSLTLSSTSHATKGKILFGISAYDEVNNRLGIGTDAPSTKLHVKSTGETLTTTLESDDGYVSILDIDSGHSASVATAAINFKGRGATFWQLGGNRVVGAGFEINEGDATNNRFYINAGGNIGINETVPSAKLDIVGNGLTLEGNATLDDATGNEVGFLLNGTVNKLTSGTGTLLKLVGTFTTEPTGNYFVEFYNSATRKFYVDDTGSLYTTQLIGPWWDTTSSGIPKTVMTLTSGGSNYGTIQANSGATANWSLGYQAAASTTVGTPVLTWNESNNVFIVGITSANSFVSGVTGATSPYACATTQLNTNLNADLLDGLHSTSFVATTSTGNFVPYVGAVSSVNLGLFNITATTGTFNGDIILKAGYKLVLDGG